MGPRDEHIDGTEEEAQSPEDVVEALAEAEAEAEASGEAEDDGGSMSGVEVLKRVAEAALIGVGLAMAVSDDTQPPDAVAEAVVEPVSTSVEPLAVTVRLLAPPAPSTPHRWGVEASGHVLALLEAGLAELSGVVPQVVGAPRSPSLEGALPPLAPGWTLDVSVDTTDETVSIEAVLCDAAQVCTQHVTQAPRTRPNAAVAELVRALGDRMDRSAGPGLDSLARPETQDDYAALVIGRAAAVAYGLREPATPEVQGDPRRDPVQRAVFLDPSSPTAWAVVARTTPDPAARVAALRSAVELRPDSVPLLADLAAALQVSGDTHLAWPRWRDVAERAPGDARYVLPRARAALAVGEALSARSILGEVHGRFDDVPAMVEAQVAVADAASGGATDGLLSHWADVDPKNAEPVRRRIRAMVDAGEREEALALTAELARRGATVEARQLTLALASELGRWDVATEAATALGKDDVASRLHVATTEQGPAARAAALAGATAPEVRLARVEALLAAGDAPTAVTEVRALLQHDPWWPEALDVYARGLDATGDAGGAAAAREKLLHVDPLFFASERR